LTNSETTYRLHDFFFRREVIDSVTGRYRRAASSGDLPIATPVRHPDGGATDIARFRL
jgi:hypothetical protein